MTPLSCYHLALANMCLFFGKNSDRPAGEVQEVVYCPRKSYSSGAQIEVSEMNVMM